MTTEQFKKRYPDRTLYDDDDDPGSVRIRHAKAVSSYIVQVAEQVRGEFGLPEQLPIGSPEAQQAGYEVFQRIEAMFPRWQSDDLEAHIAELVQNVQDDTEDPIVRWASEFRLKLYYQWQAQQFAVQAQAAGLGLKPETETPGRAARQPEGSSLEPGEIAAQVQGREPETQGA